MVADVEAVLEMLPKAYEIGAPAVRELRKQGQGALADEPKSERAEWMTAQANGREAPVRAFRPASGEARALYVHIHGGGWCIGSADAQDQSLQKFCDTYNAAAISVEYRLAPEHPWPAGPDDCETAALWALENAKSVFGTDILLIGGESAGAHLSAVTLLRLRDRNGATGFSGANLVYGAFDLSQVPSSRNWGGRNLILNDKILKWFGDQFLPPEDFPKEARRDPSVSPLFAKLHDMPPALFTIGTMDPLLDDSIFMASRWLAAGNPAELAVYPGGIHAFNAFPIEIAREANHRCLDFLADCIARAN